MKQYHGWSIEELENMIPFERQIYVQMLMDYLKEKAEEAKKNGH